jgi:lysozyme
MTRFKENMIRQLTRHEGLRLKPYLCPAGKLTIGIGRNLEGKGITKQEAVMLLENGQKP